MFTSKSNEENQVNLASFITHTQRDMYTYTFYRRLWNERATIFEITWNILNLN